MHTHNKNRIYFKLETNRSDGRSQQPAEEQENEYAKKEALSNLMLNTNKNKTKQIFSSAEFKKIESKSYLHSLPFKDCRCER
jgi:hypothetical protein